MIIDYKQISEEALDQIAREYVIAQLDEVEDSPQLNEWVRQTIDRVRAGELLIEFSQVDESVTLKSRTEVEFE